MLPGGPTVSEKLKAAIAYFEDTIRESDEIIAECSPELQVELQEQKEHFIMALEYMRRPAPEANEAPTHADRIRDMSDEELAKFLQEPFCDRRTGQECKETFIGNCDACMLDWLSQPAGED